MTATELLLWTGSILFTLYVVIVFIKQLEKRRKLPPGPTGYPFLGLVGELLPLNSIHKALTAIGKSYGRHFQFNFLGKRVVVLRSASIVEKAFDDVTCDDRKETFFQNYVFNGKGFAFANYKKQVPELRALFQ